MGYKVQIQSIARSNNDKGKRINTPRLWSKKYHNTAGKCGKRAYSFIDIMLTKFIAKQSIAVLERSLIEVAPGRISRIRKKILGSAFMGKRIFLCNGRKRDWINNKELYSKPIKWKKGRHIQDRRMSLVYFRVCFSLWALRGLQS